jgi:hypothetical protein
MLHLQVWSSTTYIFVLAIGIKSCHMRRMSSTRRPARPSLAITIQTTFRQITYHTRRDSPDGYVPACIIAVPLELCLWNQEQPL